MVLKEVCHRAELSFGYVEGISEPVLVGLSIFPVLTCK